MRMFHVTTRNGGRDSESHSALRGEAPCFDTAQVRTQITQMSDLLCFPVRVGSFGKIPNLESE